MSFYFMNRLQFNFLVFVINIKIIGDNFQATDSADAIF